MNPSVELAGMPAPLGWHVAPADWNIADDGALTVVAGAHTDLFVNPSGEVPAVLNAPALFGATSGDFMLSARVTVGFASSFDAGALGVRTGPETWAKLCLEYSPQAEAIVVSVVTRGRSDDCNSFAVEGDQVWLRISRLGRAFAFHGSADGSRWQFVRQFFLDADDEIEVGFLAQSPTGQGCTVRFDDIQWSPQRLRDLRSGD